MSLCLSLIPMLNSMWKICGKLKKKSFVENSSSYTFKCKLTVCSEFLSVKVMIRNCIKTQEENTPFRKVKTCLLRFAFGCFCCWGCCWQQQSCTVAVHHKSLSSCLLWPLQDGFVVRIYTMSSDPALQQELQLKLARKCLHACGISLFDLEKDLHIISKWLKMRINLWSVV